MPIARMSLVAATRPTAQKNAAGNPILPSSAREAKHLLEAECPAHSIVLDTAPHESVPGHEDFVSSERIRQGWLPPVEETSRSLPARGRTGSILVIPALTPGFNRAWEIPGQETWYDFAMQTVPDIPDAKFSRLTAKAEHEGASVLEIALRGIDKELAGEEAPKKVKRLTEPILQSPAPGSSRFKNEQTCGPSGPESAEQPGLTPKKRFELPVIRSSRPGSLVIDNETIYDLIDFP
jgi:hypothetical protein